MSKIIYSDDEYKRWWQGLSKVAQAELLQRMVEKAYDDRGAEFAMSLQAQYAHGRSFSIKQLASIRKWDRE